MARKAKRVRLENAVHNTECLVMMPADFKGGQCEAYEAINAAAVNGGAAAKSKLRRVRQALCGRKGCRCGVVRPRESREQGTPSVGELLRAERKRLGMLQTDIAARSGLTQGEISRLENNRGRPGFGTLRALAKAGVNINRLLA